jgi:cytochrome c2
VVSKQVSYIIYAFLYLVLIGGSYWVIEKLSIIKTNQSETITTISEKQNFDLTGAAAKGKTIFMSKCASCHAIFKDMTGPGIMGFTERAPWTDRKNIYEWIRNPSAFMARNEYTRKLKEIYKSMMTAFPDLTNEEIDAICDYINQAGQIRNGVTIAGK